jgi:hypothetical protein
MNDGCNGFSRSQLELDRLGHHWVLTYYDSNGDLYTLKVRHYTEDWPDEYTCELKRAGANESTEVARTERHPFDLLHEAFDRGTTLFPGKPWDMEFTMMARRWAHALEALPMARTHDVMPNGERCFEDLSDGE